VPEDLPPEPLPPVPEGDKPRTTPGPEAPKPERSTQQPPANPHIATAYTPTRRGPITPEERPDRETFTHAVEHARHTLFEVSKTPRPQVGLPSGQRSLFGALARARNDVGATNVRKAREQGVMPPRPDQGSSSSRPEPPRLPSNPGVEPASFAPVGPGIAIPPIPGPGNAPGTAGAGPAAEPVPEGVVDGPGPMSSAEQIPASQSAARRGLIGMLFQPRGN
jgi:hypothetical protein